MANRIVNANVDPSIRTLQSTIIDPSTVAKSAVVNTSVDPDLSSKKTKIVAPVSSTTVSNQTSPTPLAANVSMITVINTIVQNYLDSYHGSLGSAVHADVADRANSVLYTNVVSRPTLALVATTGSYNDLLNLPSFASYATTSYVDTRITSIINGAPSALDTLNELASALNNDSSFASTITTSLASKVSTSSLTTTLASYATTSYVDTKIYAWSSITGKPTFSTVATSGSYTDLTNKPTIPTDISDLTDGSSLLGGGGGTTYSNTNVSSFLSSFGSNTISTTGNIATGNITVTAAHGTLVFGDSTATGSPGLSSTTSITFTANRAGTAKELTLTSAGELYAPGNLTTTGNIRTGQLSAKASDSIDAIQFSDDGTNDNGSIKVDLGSNMVVKVPSNFYVKRGGSDRLAITDTNSDFMATNNVTIQSDKGGTTQTWTFDTDGALNLPSYGVIRHPLDVNIVATGYSQLQWVDSGNINIPNPNDSNGLKNWVYVESGGVFIDTNINNPDTSPQRAWVFNNAGQTIFPTLSTQRGDNPSGTISGYTINIGDGSQEAIITTPDGDPEGYQNSQRLVINPGKGADGTAGEGGDIYLWAGRGGTGDGTTGGGSGGDVKIRGGQGMAGNDGGYIRMEAGDSNNDNGRAGYIQIRAGETTGGRPGYVLVNGGHNLNGTGGNVDLVGGFGTGGDGAPVNITGGGSSLGDAHYGNVRVASASSFWTFDNTGNLTLPSGGDILRNGTSVLGGGASHSISNGNTTVSIPTSDGNIVLATNDGIGISVPNVEFSLDNDTVGGYVFNANSTANGIAIRGDYYAALLTRNTSAVSGDILNSWIYTENDGAFVELQTSDGSGGVDSTQTFTFAKDGSFTSPILDTNKLSVTGQGATVQFPFGNSTIPFSGDNLGYLHNDANFKYDYNANILHTPGINIKNNANIGGSLQANAGIMAIDGLTVSNSQTGSSVTFYGNSVYSTKWTAELPQTIGTSGQVLTTDGTDKLSWTVLKREQSFESKTSDFTITSGYRYGIDTRSRPISATLPAEPIIGDSIYFVDFGGRFSINTFTVVRGGSPPQTIMNETSDLVVSTDGQSFGLVYTGTTWRVY